MHRRCSSLCADDQDSADLAVNFKLRLVFIDKADQLFAEGRGYGQKAIRWIIALPT